MQLLASRFRCLNVAALLSLSLIYALPAFSQTAADRDSADSMKESLPDAPASPSVSAPKLKRPDFNDDIYYRNKVEFSLETGALWINLPFIFDVFEGGDYSTNMLHYTLIPIFPSFHWHLGKLSGPSFLRGNCDVSAAVSITLIARGPEKIYGAFDLGIRRNFVQRNWRVAPYFEGRLGAGFIDAKERPGINYAGNGYAQGEDYTFTVMTGAGVRYNFSPRYSAQLGATYYHVSNAYLSEPKWDDNGINVVGPIIGFYWRISKPKASTVR